VCQDPPEAAREAVKFVVENYLTDTMGRRGPEFTCSSFVSPNKFTKKFSNWGLNNNIPKVIASTVAETQARAYNDVVKSNERYESASLTGKMQRSITFSKSAYPAHLNWNPTTTLTNVERRSQHNEDQVKAAQNTKSRQGDLLGSYLPPIKQQETIAQLVKEKKEKTANELASFREDFGVQHAEKIMSMTLRRQELMRNGKFKPRSVLTKTDKEALVALDHFKPKRKLDSTPSSRGSFRM